MAHLPRLLVTGGSGELGAQVLAAARDTWDVHATFFCHAPRQTNPNWHRLDVADGDAVHDLIASLRPDVVVHTAVSDRSRLPGQSVDRLSSVMVEGGRHVAEACRAVAARCIALSTDLVFDGRKGGYTEEDVPNPIMPYGRAKLDMERAMSAALADLLVVRTSLILTLEPVGRHAAWILEALRARETRVLFTDELRCPIWSDELACALLELSRLECRGLMHVAGPEVTQRYDLGLRMAAYYGLPAEHLVPGLSAESGLNRPLDCTLDCRRAYGTLRTPIHGVSVRLPRVS